VTTIANLDVKQDSSLALLRDLGSVIVAYSGGADSAYLAWAAHQALGPGAVAITADSASFPESHRRDAEEFADADVDRHLHAAHRAAQHDVVTRDLDMTQAAIGSRVARFEAHG